MRNVAVPSPPGTACEKGPAQENGGVYERRMGGEGAGVGCAEKSTGCAISAGSERTRIDSNLSGDERIAVACEMCLRSLVLHVRARILYNLCRVLRKLTPLQVASLEFGQFFAIRANPTYRSCPREHSAYSLCFMSFVHRITGNPKRHRMCLVFASSVVFF